MSRYGDCKTLNIGPIYVTIGKYQDWGRYKQYYQIRLNENYSHLFNCYKNFKTIENAEKYIRKQIKKHIKNVAKELSNGA